MNGHLYSCYFNFTYGGSHSKPAYIILSFPSVLQNWDSFTKGTDPTCLPVSCLGLWRPKKEMITVFAVIVLSSLPHPLLSDSPSLGESKITTKRSVRNDNLDAPKSQNTESESNPGQNPLRTARLIGWERNNPLLIDEVAASPPGPKPLAPAGFCKQTASARCREFPRGANS
ncbi:hypothetical protein DSO57_1009093 [Entomophthora muscae]|uniref:Uncharacterized protein n=1 Tax=Entomophthora muscae TaxID=34485 RepID=A0ACC2S8V7_9FUNG|nr:hypothetical protein DSO57_1009093 [Entomophthora muscae]